MIRLHFQVIGVTNSFPKSVRHIAGYNAVFRIMGNYLYKGKKRKMKNHGTFVLNDTILLVVQYNKIRRTIALEPKLKLKQRPTRKPTNNIYNRIKGKRAKPLEFLCFSRICHGNQNPFVRRGKSSISSRAMIG